MDREILFRGFHREPNGKDIAIINGTPECGTWLYGNLLRTDDGWYIVQNYIPPHMLSKYEVEPSTIGQYTGQDDKNGKKIFEGDIVKTNKYGKDDGHGHNFAGPDTFEVAFEDGGYCLRNQWRRFNLRPDAGVEVIGSVHDNPELLEGK